MRFNPLIPVLGVLLGSCLVAALGWLGTASLTLPSPVFAAAPEAGPIAATPDPASVEAGGGIFNVNMDTPLGAEGAETGADLSGVGCGLSEGFPDSILQWCQLITHYSTQRGLSPDLIASLILQESGGNSDAYSHSGAVGLMQIMPRDGIAAGFMCINGPCFGSRPATDELWDPEFNISYGTKMLAGLINHHGDVREALRSYGPMDVGYSYADTVLAIQQRYGQPTHSQAEAPGAE